MRVQKECKSDILSGTASCFRFNNHNSYPWTVAGIYSHSAAASHHEATTVSTRQRNVSGNRVLTFWHRRTSIKVGELYWVILQVKAMISTFLEPQGSRYHHITVENNLRLFSPRESNKIYLNEEWKDLDQLNSGAEAGRWKGDFITFIFSHYR